MTKAEIMGRIANARSFQEVSEILAAVVALLPDPESFDCRMCWREMHPHGNMPKEIQALPEDCHKGEPIQLRPADPPLPSGPPIVNFDAISKGGLYAQIAKVTGRQEGEIELDLRRLLDQVYTYAGHGEQMQTLNRLAEAALRLAGVIR